MVHGTGKNTNNVEILYNSYCYNKSYSVYIKYYSKQGEKIMVLVRILMSKSIIILVKTFYD
jgi:hypothetical protein